MNKKNSITISFLITIFNLNCICSDNINICTQSEKIVLQKSDTISIPLDKYTSPYSEYFKLVTINDTLYLTFLNKHNNSIYCYNYENKRLHKTIKGSRNNEIYAFELVSWDKLYMFYYWEDRIVCQTASGKENGQILLSSYLKDIPYYPCNGAPIIHNKGYLYMASGKQSYKKAYPGQKVVIRIDTSLSRVDMHYSFPDVYYKHYFGGAHYREDIKYTLNDELQMFVFSFPASHQINRTSDFKSDFESCAGSKYVNKIPTFRKFSDRSSFAFDNPIYFNIYYDPYNKLYYRMCFLPVNEEEIKKNGRDVSIIILNEQFEIMGEQKIDNNANGVKYAFGSSIVTPDGLLIRQSPKPGNEEYMKFSVFVPVKKQ